MGFPLFNRVTGDFRAFLFQMAAPLSPHSLCPEVASSFEGGYSIIKQMLMWCRVVLFRYAPIQSGDTASWFLVDTAEDCYVKSIEVAPETPPLMIC
jgi:hypothetical protein